MRYKPPGSRQFQEYAYFVITETDADRRPAGSKAEYMDYFHRGQIILCDITGGTPIEVGTHTKPGKLNCLYDRFDTVYEAIDRAYEVGECGFDQRPKGRHKNTWQEKRKGKKKIRHKA